MPDNFLRLFGSASGAAIEWFAVFSFVAYALVYFLAPVLGYQSQNRGLLLASLYLLVGYGLLVFLQLLIQYFMVLVSSNGPSTERAALHLVYIFAIFKLLLFLAAQGAFVLGLQGLRRGSADRQ